MNESVINSLIDMTDDGNFIDPEIMLQTILDDPNLVQHITRCEQAGRAIVTGYFRVDFQPHQQRQVLHVPFTPPLKVIPRVEAQATDQQDVRVRVTDRQKFGIRAEIILPRPTESSCRLTVEIIATEAD